MPAVLDQLIVSINIMIHFLFLTVTLDEIVHDLDNLDTNTKHLAYTYSIQ